MQSENHTPVEEHLQWINPLQNLVSRASKTLAVEVPLHYSINGGSFAQRLITQCYFPGDPLQDDDFVYQAVTNKAARERLIVKYAPEYSIEGFAAGYTFDIVLRGQNATPMER